MPAGTAPGGMHAGHPPAEVQPVNDRVPEWLVERPGDPAFLQWVGEIPDTVAQRIACDADVWRIVLDPASGRPLDVGRAHRVAPHWIRKALHARDRKCRFPGCHAPPAWTDAHHLVPWSNNGPTTLANLILQCRFHHVLLHEGGWQLTYDVQYNTVTVRRPDGRPYEITEHSTMERAA
jgi:hypothetical protein